MEMAENVFNIAIGGTGGDAEMCRNILPAAAMHQEVEHGAVARGEGGNGGSSFG